jgi:large subunit ribosomal protein L30
MAKLKVTYKKSSICCPKDQKATIQSLGLRKLGVVVLHPDTPSIRGMLFKVQHLVKVEVVDDVYTLPTRTPTVRPRVVSTPHGEEK